MLLNMPLEFVMWACGIENEIYIQIFKKLIYEFECAYNYNPLYLGYVLKRFK